MGEGSMAIVNNRYNKSNNKLVLPGSRRLSDVEMDEKRGQELCYWCDEKYTPNISVVKERKYSFLNWMKEQKMESGRRIWWMRRPLRNQHSILKCLCTH